MNIFNNPDVQRLSRIFQSNSDNRSKTTPPQSVGRSSSGDSVNLSQEAKILAGIMHRLDEAPDIRRDKVQGLKDQIANGTYHVASGDIADAMIREGVLS